MTYIQKTTCPYDCPALCGLLAETDGKKILKVTGDPEHPFFHGLICEKMRHYEEDIHSEKRILTPLKRVGEKGKGEFVPVSWEEAVKDITDHWKDLLETYGPESILSLSSSGTQGLIQKNIINALFNKMGARPMVMGLCASAKQAAYQSCTAGKGCLCPSEMKDSDYYIIWGCNIKSTMVHVNAMLAEQRKKGKKVVLIEVCGVDTAKYCDETVLVRPGTDGALALAMMHVLAKEGLTADEFLKEFSEGFEEFKATLDNYPPEWAEKITGVPAETIVRLAREFGAAKAPAIFHGVGNTRYANGGMTGRLILILSAITGAWANPGGGYAGRNPKSGPCIDMNKINRPDLRTYDAKYANINLLSEVLSETGENAVRSFYLSGGNPVNAIHNQKLMLKALSREDLFFVVHERYLTDTAKYADYILPATFSVEHTDLYTPVNYNAISSAFPVIPPAGECKSNWDTICLLAKGMGYEEDIFRMTAEEMLTGLLEHPKAPLDTLPQEQLDILRKGGTLALPYGDHLHFPTPSGKFRIVDNTLPEPMPHYFENFKDPWPLGLVAIPNDKTLNTIFNFRDSLVKARGERKLIMHPEDAAARGIQDGDPVIAKNDLAEVSYIAQISNLIAKGAVGVSGVYNLSEGPNPYDTNALHHSRVADMGGSTTLSSNRVEVVLAK